MQNSRSIRLPLLAFGEWLVLLPATVFLAAGTLRQLQPRQYEPSRTSWMIFEWTLGHVSRLGATMLFIVAPCAVLMVGCAALWTTSRENQDLRKDAGTVLDILRRQRLIGVLAAATLLAAVILAFVGIHIITD